MLKYLWVECHHVCNSVSNGSGRKNCVHRERASIYDIMLTLLNLGGGQNVFIYHSFNFSVCFKFFKTKNWDKILFEGGFF